MLWTLDDDAMLRHFLLDRIELETIDEIFGCDAGEAFYRAVVIGAIAPAEPIQCRPCEGQGRLGRGSGALPEECEECRGQGWHGIDPERPTLLRQDQKVCVLQARYARGLPLFHPDDAA